MTKWTGGCQCGQLRYELKNEPLGAYCCHCTQCQRQSGSAFGESLIVARGDWQVTQGEVSTWSRTTERGSVTICHFCAECGTRVMHERQGNAQRVIVKPGTLDAHIWPVTSSPDASSSAQAWMRPLLTGLVYEEQPDPMVFAWKR